MRSPSATHSAEQACTHSTLIPRSVSLRPFPTARRASTAAQLPLSAASVGRRIAIAYNSFPVGRGLLQFARDKVLTHRDRVYICHVFSNHNPVSSLPCSGHRDSTRARTWHAVCNMFPACAATSPAAPPPFTQVVKETIKFMRAVTLQKADSLAEVTRDNCIQVGRAAPTRVARISPRAWSLRHAARSQPRPSARLPAPNYPAPLPACPRLPCAGQAPHAVALPAPVCLCSRASVSVCLVCDHSIYAPSLSLSSAPQPLQFGAAELAGYKVEMGVTLQVGVHPLGRLGPPLLTRGCHAGVPAVACDPCQIRRSKLPAHLAMRRCLPHLLLLSVPAPLGPPQGDPKSALAAFCESEEIELLIIGSRSGGKIRKRLRCGRPHDVVLQLDCLAQQAPSRLQNAELAASFSCACGALKPAGLLLCRLLRCLPCSGGGVSSHLIDNASCPCLVVPYK